MEESVMQAGFFAGFYHRDFIEEWPNHEDITDCCDKAVSNLQKTAAHLRKKSVVAIEFPQGTQLYVKVEAKNLAAGGLRIHASAFFKTPAGERIDPACFRCLEV